MQVLSKDKNLLSENVEPILKEAAPLMKRAGGYFYPRNFIAENSEMLLFAAILAIGIRTFFLQPFKIPTNSMYPTYNGMTAKVYVQDDGPVLPVRLFRLLTLGSKHFSVEAPVSGELAISGDQKVVPGRKWLILPTKKVRYTFYVGNTPAGTLDLPLDFDIGQVIQPLIADGKNSVARLSNGARVMKTGIHVEAGETAFSFDLLTGDALFVDRMTYHFRRPKVGQPIVFRTQNLENIDRANKGKYYIKRCVGGPGDTLQIDPPALLRNGKPATGAEAFEKNRTQEAPYKGYVYGHSTRNYAIPFFKGDEPLTIPEGNYFAMGDNSSNSADSRMWGFVPQTEIVGKAVLIYYPFSHRWGLAD
jgi:signal peptidase I